MTGSTKYPIGIDTDAELPRVDNDVTLVGGLCINALRTAVFAIEKALGIKPQGTATDLVTRLGISLDDNGYIKTSALAGIGLVTLPITNAQVGAAAGIEESKLDLNYGTVLLKSWIDSLRVRVDALENAVALDIAHLAQHTAIPSTWGRHSTGDIDAYGVFTGRNAQGALTNLDTRLNAHIADPIDAHDGSAISLDANRFSTITATDVQSATEQLEDLQLIEIINHRDRQHGNGILGTQDSFISGTKHGVVIIPASATNSGSVGDTYIKFLVAPTSSLFLSIVKNDRIDLTVAGKTYTFNIESTQSSNQVNIFGRLPVSGFGTAVVYKNAEETTEPSVAMVCLRKNDLASRPSTLQIIHPSAPYIISSGFHSGALSVTSRNIRLLYPSGNTGNLDVYTAMVAFYASPSSWTAENVAKVLNYSLLSPGISGTNYPIVAFAYKGELGFAYDLPDGYIAIGTATATPATTSLGFVTGTISYAMEPRDLYIDGYEIPSINPLFDARGKITASDTITFYGINPLALGIASGNLARVSIYERGTYVVNSVTASTLVFDSVNEHDFTASLNEWVRVQIYADAFSISAAPARRSLYEVFLDGYADGYGPVASLKTTIRATYIDTLGGGSGLESIFDMTAISRTFGSTSRRMFYDFSARTVVLGTPVAGPSVSLLGVKVTLPVSSEQGFRFPLYDANGVDYIDFEIANALPGSDGYMDISTYPAISEERFLQVATVLHDKTQFKYLDDTRQFGNLGRKDVRDDFTRDYISYPCSLLRGNGVIYGFVASGTSILSVTGGQALVNGQLKSVGKTTFAIPADGVITTYNLFMDTDGVLRFELDDHFSSGILSTPSIAELLTSKTETALAQIAVNGSNVITAITDMRRFVNDIDSKLDLLVEENDITHGSFASLAAAVAYLNALPIGSPISRKIKVRGEVILSTSVTLPSYTILEGDGYSGTSGAKITFLSSTATIVLGSGNIIRDLAFHRSGVLTYGFLSGTSISNAKIENCGFEFVTQASGNIAISCGYLNETNITGCRFKNVGKGIWADKGGQSSQIIGNRFDGAEVNAIVVETAGTYGATYMTIADNIFSTASLSTAAGTAFIRLGNPLTTTIRGNIFTTTASSVATMQMLHFKGASYFCRIVGNSFENSGSGIGFQKAIWFDGLGGASAHLGDTIDDNVIGYFAGGSANAVLLNYCDGTLITNNYIAGSRTPLKITEGIRVHICNNNLFGVDDAIVLNIASPTSGEHFIIANNVISSAFVVNTRIVELNTSSTGVGGTFYGNTVRYATVIGFYGYTMLYVNGTEWHIINNDVGCSSLLGVLTVAPITLTASSDRCMIIQNNVYHAVVMPATLSKINISTASNVVEMLNKGQIYYITVPNTYAREDRLALGTSTWGAVPYFKSTQVSYDVNVPNVIWAFGEDFVPSGAIINNVKVNYTISPGAAADLWMGWSCARGLPSSNFDIRVPTVVSSAGSLVTETITPSIPPVIMVHGDIHYISITAMDDSDTWTIILNDLQITYIL